MPNNNDQLDTRVTVLEVKHNHHENKITTIETSLKELADSVKSIQLTLERFFGRWGLIVVMAMIIVAPVINNIIQKLFNH